MASKMMSRTSKDKRSSTAKIHADARNKADKNLPKYPSFDNCLSYLCFKYKVAPTIVCERTESGTAIKKSQSMSEKTEEQKVSNEEVQSAKEVFSTEILPPHTTLYCTYGDRNQLTELKIINDRAITRETFFLISLIDKWYPTLNKITIKNCAVVVEMLRDLSTLISHNNITEVCLDDSRCHGDFSVLLNVSGLKILSLCRCSIEDDVCEKIATKINYAGSCGKTLQHLNLTSNFITNRGAKCLGAALKSNRSLRYLNVSGNWISDDGAVAILNALSEFPLSFDDIKSGREESMNFLKREMAVFLRHYLTLKNPLAKDPMKEVKDNIRMSARKSTRKTLTEDDRLQLKAQELTSLEMGKFFHPFAKKFTRFDSGVWHCLGNYSLCYLNLAYNNLHYLSMKALKFVLQQQKQQVKSEDGTGLMRVVLNGNPIPECVEEVEIRNLLDEKITLYAQPAPKTVKLK